MFSFLGQFVRLTLVVCFFAVVAAARAQSENSAPPTSSQTPGDTPVAEGVREVKPETYVVRDKDGRLVPMPNMSYEDFRKYVERELQSEDSVSGLPAYTLQELLITGTADSVRADLRVTATVRLLRDGWVRVPIRFGDAVLRAPAVYAGKGHAFVDTAQDESGYICWMQAPKDETHRITLELSVPLRRLGGQRRLTLQVPRATSSALDLRVPVADAQATVSSGLLEVAPERESTKFHVDGLTPDFQISWSDGTAAFVESRPLLQAEIKSLIKVDGVREVSGEVEVTVSSLRGSFDTFTLRLPAGATLIPRPSPSGQYLVSELGSQDASQEPRVQVKLERRIAGPVSIPLLTTLSAVANGKTPEYDTGGVEVENAVRQAHVIDFVVDDDLSVNWRPGPNVQRTIVPDEAAGAIDARFESYRRSNSLRFQVSSQEAQVSVDPVYVLDVEAGRIRLTATLHYKIRRTSTFGVDVYLPDWRVDQIVPEAIVDTQSLERDKREPLHIPLKPSAIQENGEFTLQIEAVQEIDDESETISVALPRPQAKLLAPATVVVVPADNIALTVSEDRLQGLERESSPPDVAVPKRQQSPLYFREQSDASTTVFAAAFRQRRRSVSLSPRCLVEATQQRIRVRQTFDYRVAYEPLRNLDFLVPREVLEGSGLKFLDEQQALPYSQLAAASPEDTENGTSEDGASEESSGGDEMVRVQVDLLAERIGECLVAVEYEQEMVALPEEGPRPLQLPLVVPAKADDMTTTAFHLQLMAADGLQLRAEGEIWELGPTLADPDRSPTQVARTVPADLKLILGGMESGTPVTTTIRQIWIQSWLEPRRRRDRAVYRVSTQDPQITVRLPQGAELQYAAIDGRRVQVDLQDDFSVVMDVEGSFDEPLEEHVIELWYMVARQQPTAGQFSLQPPTVPGTTRTNRWYWSLATPATDHLLFLPDELTPEMTWQRHGIVWRRQPRLQQAELERWIGASRQEELPPTLNRYLFGSFGEVPQLRCTLGERSVLVLVVSGAALASGLLLIHFRRLRHPAWLFLVGLALVALVLMYPDLSLAAFQASLLGIGLVLAALMLKWIVDWRQARRGIVRGALVASPDSKTVKATRSLDAGPADTPATTASLPVEVSAGEASA